VNPPLLTLSKWDRNVRREGRKERASEREREREREKGEVLYLLSERLPVDKLEEFRVK
jgi:hypothetical protein